MKKLLHFFPLFPFLLLFLYSSYSFSQFSMWGMANSGGSHNAGVIFKYTPSTNTFLKVFDFTTNYQDSIGHTYYDTTGGAPQASLLLANNGKLYGTACAGGSCDNQYLWGNGVLFEYNLVNGKYSSLITFGQNCHPLWGYKPMCNLIQAGNGNIYSTQSMDMGGCGEGTLFEYNIDSSAYHDKADFGCGVYSSVGSNYLDEALDGNIYGVCNGGWPPLHGAIYRYKLLSSTFKYFPYNESYYGGEGGYNGFVEGDIGKLYALEAGYGVHSYGTIFQFNYIDSTFTKEWDFDSINDGGVLTVRF